MAKTKLKKDILYYDKGDDSLTFLNKSLDAEYTINTGLVLLRINKKKNIVGIELMGANKNFKIPKKVLENLTISKVKFDYHKKIKRLIITILLYYRENKPIRIIEDVAVTGINDNISTLKATSCA